MCLLLGPPGSGRSTLLKALAGQLMRDKDLKVLISIFCMHAWPQQVTNNVPGFCVLRTARGRN